MLDPAYAHKGAATLKVVHYPLICVPDKQARILACLPGEPDLVVYGVEDAHAPPVCYADILLAVGRREVYQAAACADIHKLLGYGGVVARLPGQLAQFRDPIQQWMYVPPSLKVCSRDGPEHGVLPYAGLLEKLLQPRGADYPCLVPCPDVVVLLPGVESHHCVSDQRERHRGPHHKVRVLISKLHLVVQGRVLHLLVSLVHLGVAQRGLTRGAVCDYGVVILQYAGLVCSLEKLPLALYVTVKKRPVGPVVVE